MTFFATDTGGPLARVFFGGRRAGSVRGGIRTVRGLRGRNVKVGSLAASSTRRFLRGNFTVTSTGPGPTNFTVTSTGHGLTGLRGRRSGNRGIILGAELGRRVTTTVRRILLDGRRCLRRG